MTRPAPRLDEDLLLTGLATLLGTETPTPYAMTQLAASLKLPRGAGSCVFFNGLGAIVRGLPPGSFLSDGQQAKLLLALEAAQEFEHEYEDDLPDPLSPHERRMREWLASPTGSRTPR